MTARVIAPALLCVFVASFAVPDTCDAASRSLRKARKSFANYDFEGLVPVLKRALKEKNSRAEQADIYRMIGIVHAVYRKPVLAKKAFLKAFARNPNLEIGGDYPPKIREPFNAAKKLAGKKRAGGGGAGAGKGASPGPKAVVASAKPDNEGRSDFDAPTSGFDADAAAAPDEPATAVVTEPAEPASKTEIFATSASENAALAPMPGEPSVRVRRSTPFYKTWWFWTVAGVVVAAGAGGTAYMMTRDTAPSHDYGPYPVR